ncbi:bifunctional 3-(3-hydroxy-phenyl)propionate/3-hydroxycinnamic acid hydroxylase [Jiangella asiatica]|uniref:Bifunctional 3-(3-hydroxy-phenyl)propionate/3-hydroxycinnamic acid hydroxylase n=1 Tax=Jiangella asiatica TaxID=2530372 RepID=A0A4R5DAJ2_9ACTN|nr:bifunctional 3-(3-hydroxy-phenyl)propionate/3-hydroxycinnamic acid hydroxylase [Jiangella asiatica]TDE08464.1 bifunctional 3-(3-hydroxy-phenyl)propionate/3-hydroxycinnamic acid hydroxylase [Jiangella asiatica]
MRATTTPVPGAGPLVTEVLVVGSGPTGLTVANLLGTFGITTLLVERNTSTSEEAKAISLDDESLRTLQAAGLDAEVYSVVVPGTGTRYFSARGRPLFHARGPGRRLGHSFKNSFAQPDLERVLAAGLARFPHVTVLFGTELHDLDEDSSGVDAVLTDVDGQERRVRARYVLGCDGGRSTVRDLAGIQMTGVTFPDRWLVVDALGDQHDQRYAMHVGDWRRPHVIVAGRDGRCRYEFWLRPGEADPGPDPPFDLVRRLVGRYRPLRPDDVERSVVYGFHALLAERFSHGRCFLLGDAAHMMPPFAGQGLNSGVRDATNLAWKLAAVLSGRARPTLLDTYEQERRPHAQATVDLSVRLGSIVMTTSRTRALARDAFVASAMRLPAGRRFLEQMRYRPAAHLRQGFLVGGAGGVGGRLVGRPLPQPTVLAGDDHAPARLDDVLGPGPTVLGIDLEPELWAALSDLDLRPLDGRRVDVRLDDRASWSRNGRTAVADLDGQLEKTFGHARGRLVFVRPDRIVAAVVHPSRLGGLPAALSPYTPAPEDVVAPAPGPAATRTN